MSASKQCRDCKQVLPHAEFGKDKNRPDGVAIYCKKCRAEQARFRYTSGLVTRRFGVQTCQHCHKSYTPTGPGQRYCSVACRFRAAARSAKCELCGKDYQPKSRGQRFCSLDCKYNRLLGTRRKTAEGYILVRVPEDTPGLRRDRAWMFEHRFVMQQKLGRELTAMETVHHRNGKRSDNRPENLEVRTGNHGKHAAFMCADCGSRNIIPCTPDADGR